MAALIDKQNTRLSLLSWFALADFNNDTAVIIVFCSPIFFSPRCHLLHQLLHEDPQLKQLWQNAILWLQSEMERVCRQAAGAVT